MTVLTGQQISKFRLITLARGIQHETNGMRMTRGRSCLAIIKKEFGWKGNRASILERLNAHIDSLPNTP